MEKNSQHSSPEDDPVLSAMNEILHTMGQDADSIATDHVQRAASGDTDEKAAAMRYFGMPQLSRASGEATYTENPDSPFLIIPFSGRELTGLLISALATLEPKVANHAREKYNLSADMPLQTETDQNDGSEPLLTTEQQLTISNLVGLGLRTCKISIQDGTITSPGKIFPPPAIRKNLSRFLSAKTNPAEQVEDVEWGYNHLLSLMRQAHERQEALRANVQQDIEEL